MSTQSVFFERFFAHKNTHPVFGDGHIKLLVCRVEILVVCNQFGKRCRDEIVQHASRIQCVRHALHHLVRVDGIHQGVPAVTNHLSSGVDELPGHAGDRETQVLLSWYLRSKRRRDRGHFSGVRKPRFS